MASTCQPHGRIELQPIVISYYSTNDRDDVQKEIEDLIGDVMAIEDIYPATPLQSAMFAQTMMEPTSYLNQVRWIISYEIDVDMLAKAISQIMEAHSILRTRFVSTSQGIYQVLQKNLLIPLQNIQGDVEEYMQQDIQQGFGILNPVWFRAGLWKSTNHSELIFTIHHCLYDGWCLDVIYQDLFKAYSGQSIAKSTPFKSLIQYIESQDKKESEDFWTNYLAKVEPDSGLSSFSNKNSTQTSAGPFELSFTISKEELSKAASQMHVTLATLIKAAWALTLKLFTQKDLIVFGNIVSGRDLPLNGIQR
jgi:NRPS condensation-like uncharacterized protein